MGIIRYKINYEVKEKRKFEQFLEQYQEEIGYNLEELKIERYWKIEEQFQATFLIKTESSEKEKRVYETLILANKLVNTVDYNLKVYGPHDNGFLTFRCFVNNEKDDQPLKWAWLEIENEQEEK